MPFRDLLSVINSLRLGPGYQPTGLSTQSHGATQIRGFGALLDRAVCGLPLSDQRNDGMGGVRLHLGRVCAIEVTDITRVFDERHVHTQANTKEGNTLLPGIPHRFNLALDTAITEATGDEDGIQMRQQPHSLSLNLLSIDVVNLYPGIGLQTRVIEGLIQ